ncbi:YajG family lipoprotein [Motilimonas sp. E26]|uniref:YajG family lipoprotein n=1 Tax=Motilimonas sp. E26 TaxID=2865674 RepID=UPI001E2B4C90|nr:YajG family lipoprotein [Motilimonas sp. E26]MCE0556005.1 YajG family lipoprotein [Motilimonas sp. E26]
MKSLLVPLLGLALLSGCSSSLPLNLHLSPKVAEQTVKYPANTTTALVSSDLRTQPHIVSIQEDDKPTTLVNNDVPVRILLADKLGQGLTEQGVTITGSSSTKLHLDVVAMETKIIKNGTSFDAQSTTQLTLVIEKPTRKITKQYKTVSTKTGPFSPTAAELEEGLNKQLTTLLADILNDKQLFEELNKKD